MPFDSRHLERASVVVRVLPLVAKEDCFALKGGTAINLFIRDLPRLSIDIDLTYLPVQSREDSLTEIDAALKRISDIAGKKYRAGSPDRGRRCDETPRARRRHPDQDRSQHHPARQRIRS